MELQIVEIRLQIVELDIEYPAGFVPGFFSFWCQVLLRNKIYNTQRQKITTAVKKKIIQRRKPLAPRRRGSGARPAAQRPGGSRDDAGFRPPHSLAFVKYKIYTSFVNEV